MLDSAIQVNLFLIQYCRRLVGDLADEQLAEQPVAGINHPAWLLGHLAWTADRALDVLGAPALLPAEWAALFGRGSTPSTSRRLHIQGRIGARRRAGISAIEGDARSASSEQLSRPTAVALARETLPTATELVAFLLSGHMGIHLGQLSAWRRLIGLPPMF